MVHPFTALNLALSQEDRMARAPDPSRVKVDDRSLAQLLSLAVEHGKLIRFYDLSNAPDGDWSALFSSDPAIALATQASLDVSLVEQEMQAIGRRLRLDDRPLVRPDAWQDLVSLVRHLVAILRRRPLREGPLASVLHQIEQPVALVDAANSLSRFLESTGLDLRLGSQPILLKDSELRRLENLLRDFLGVLLSELEGSRQRASQELEAELGRQGHAAHVALYIAFARLLLSIQERLNNFPASLLDFYHQQVLHQTTIADQTLRADRLALTFRAKPETSTVLVPRGTLFSAGEDSESQAILFGTEQDLEVSAARLQGLRAMRVEGSQVGTLMATDAVWLTDINLPLPYPAAGPLLPLFGADQPKTSSFGTTTAGEVGFAIASPLLLLEGGHRLVRLTLRVTPECLQSLRGRLEGADSAALTERIRWTLEKDLNWEYTSTDGLRPLDAEALLLQPRQATPESLAIALVFRLPPAAPPWRSSAPWGDQPLLLARLRNADPADALSASVTAQGKVTPLTVLSLLRLVRVELAVEVRDLPPSSLRSSAGSLDPAQPLPIFGPSPVCGSIFSVEAAEFIDKPLDTITLHIDWHGLPISRDGFRGYYSGYRLDGDGQSHPPGELFDNGLFQVRLDLEASEAEEILPGATLPLFQSHGPEGENDGTVAASIALSPTTALTLDNLKGRSGVRNLRLTLISPPHAFGDVLYSINCLEASRQMAASILDKPTAVANSAVKRADLVWPHPPWCPKAAGVHLDYKCAATIPMPGLKAEHHAWLLHLSPLEGLAPVEWPSQSWMDLLPPLVCDGQREREGSLLLTLSQPVTRISLLFGLANTGRVDPLVPSPQLQVEAWDVNGGRIDQGIEFQDGTEGMSRTGILGVRLPSGCGCSRLKLRVSGLGASPPDLVCLEPHAVWASWQGPGGRQLLNRSRAAGSVTTPLEKLSGIEEIRQPLPSSGGVAPSSGSMEKVRLAERMHHKERAIQPDDYALLLLRSFPFLWQVAVLPAHNAKLESEAGCVTIIPIPGPDSPTIADPTTPSCDASLGDQLLKELRNRVSPFVQLQMAPPPYCRIKVRAKVIVNDEMRASTLLEQLQADLVRFLSPWPCPELGDRPKIYYDEAAISQFIRNRTYVKSIDNIELELECIAEDAFCTYYTSALRHELSLEASHDRLGEHQWLK